MINRILTAVYALIPFNNRICKPETNEICIRLDSIVFRIMNIKPLHDLV